MKKLDFLFSILFFFLVTSCSSDGDICEILEKTTYKPFDHLENVYVFNYNIYKKPLFREEKIIGDMFVIVNLDDNTIHDYVIYGEEPSSSYGHGIPLGKEKRIYYNYLMKTQKIACLDPSKSEVEFLDMGTYGILINDICKRERAIISDWNLSEDENGNTRHMLRILNGETKEISEPFDASKENVLFDEGGVFDNKGNYWFTYNGINEKYIAELNCTTQKIKPLDYTLSFKDRETEGFYTYFILHVTDDFILLKKSFGPASTRKQELYMLDLNNGELKEINTSESKMDKISRIIEIKNRFFAATFTENRDGIIFFEIDLENLTTRRMNDFVEFPLSPSEAPCIIGSRVYYKQTSNGITFYNYFDPLENVVGKGWILDPNNFTITS